MLRKEEVNHEEKESKINLNPISEINGILLSGVCKQQLLVVLLTDTILFRSSMGSCMFYMNESTNMATTVRCVNISSRHGRSVWFFKTEFPLEIWKLFLTVAVV